MNILDEIMSYKQVEVRLRKREISSSTLEERIHYVRPPLNFQAALTQPNTPGPRLIAEIKKQSPSRGILREDLDPVRLAQTYTQFGAAAISILTDEKYFGGSLGDLRAVASLQLGLPLLRKDFIFDPFQILESRAAGADAILLITAVLSRPQLEQLIDLTVDLGMTPLVETHNQVEIDKAVAAGATVIGINNRDLKSFKVNLETCLELCSYIPPECTVVAESGIRNNEDVQRLKNAGIDAMLIGESLVTAENLGQQVQLFAQTAPQDQTSQADSMHSRGF